MHYYLNNKVDAWLHEKAEPDSKHANQGGGMYKRRERIETKLVPYDAEREAFFDMNEEELQYYRDRMNEEAELKHGL